jgi:hypothetical protein
MINYDAVFHYLRTSCIIQMRPLKFSIRRKFLALPSDMQNSTKSKFIIVIYGRRCEIQITLKSCKPACCFAKDNFAPRRCSIENNHVSVQPFIIAPLLEGAFCFGRFNLDTLNFVNKSVVRACVCARGLCVCPPPAAYTHVL